MIEKKKSLIRKFLNFFYASNIFFNVAGSKAFMQMINNFLFLGYNPPNRKKFAGQLLDEVNKQVDCLDQS